MEPQVKLNKVGTTSRVAGRRRHVRLQDQAFMLKWSQHYDPHALRRAERLQLGTRPLSRRNQADNEMTHTHQAVSTEYMAAHAKARPSFRHCVAGSRFASRMARLPSRYFDERRSCGPMVVCGYRIAAHHQHLKRRSFASNKWCRPLWTCHPNRRDAPRLLQLGCPFNNVVPLTPQLPGVSQSELDTGLLSKARARTRQFTELFR